MSEMNKTIFQIKHMDCASEEQMIRMKLDGLNNIHNLVFDLQERKLEVIHSDGYEDILKRLESLNLDTTFISSEKISATNVEKEDADTKLLWQVLLINFFFFVLEIVTGFVANSMGLVADSLDMLADSIVYGLSLFAVGISLKHKKNIATISGYFQLSLAVMGFVEVIRRFVGFEEIPSFNLMIIISVFALMGNTLSLFILQKSRSKEVHMKASMIFTSNDIIANAGVIIAGVLVLLTNSKYPDLVIGLIIFALVARGSYRILQLSK